jgi:hypothetical protein
MGQIGQPASSESTQFRRVSVRHTAMARSDPQGTTFKIGHQRRATTGSDRRE